MNKLNDGGPAFPGIAQIPDGVEPDTNNGFGTRFRFKDVPVPGMSLRDWFAGRFMERAQSLSEHDGEWDFETAAVCAYQMADAMLAERVKE